MWAEVGGGSLFFVAPAGGGVEQAEHGLVQLLRLLLLPSLLLLLLRWGLGGGMGGLGHGSVAARCAFQCSPSLESYGIVCNTDLH